MKQKRHGYTEFPADWLMNTPRQRLTRDEQYSCLLLKFRAWAEPQDKIATLPDDDLFLSECAEIPLQEFKRVKDRVMSLEFVLNKTTKRWEHTGLSRFKTSYGEFIQACSQAGIKSGLVRRNKMKVGLNIPSKVPSTDLQDNERTLNVPSKPVRRSVRRSVQRDLELPVPFPFPVPVLKDTDKHISEFFPVLWNVYPVKNFEQEALRHYRRTVRTEEDLKNIQKALETYLKHLGHNKWKTPQSGDRWFLEWKRWVDFEEVKTNGRSRKLGFTEPDLSTY